MPKTKPDPMINALADLVVDKMSVDLVIEKLVVRVVNEVIIRLDQRQKAAAMPKPKPVGAKAKPKTPEQLYRVFAQTAAQYDPRTPTAWYEVINQMRKSGTPIATTLGPGFAARFNIENNCRLFRIRETTRKKYLAGLRPGKPLSKAA